MTYQYSGSGNPMQTIYNEPNLSLSHINGLDRFGRIVNHGWMKGDEAKVQISHDYDNAGNRVSRHDSVNTANSEAYSYDGLNQIKSLKRENFAEAWQHDKTGNWAEYNRNGNIEKRQHNAANEILDLTSHDKNGNIVVIHEPDVKRSGTSGLKLKYDAWNRLVEVRNENDELVAEYAYNGLNQRIQKKVGQTVTQSFFNENWQELETVRHSRAGGNPVPQELTTFIWGLRYVDDLVYRERDGERLYSLADANWNVVCVTDKSGDVKERYVYDGFGKVSGLKSDWNRTFTGQVYDNETGLMLYRNRYYSPSLGRFVSRDPILYEAGDVNVYRYVGNIPSRYRDSFGLQSNKPLPIDVIGGGASGPPMSEYYPPGVGPSQPGSGSNPPVLTPEQCQQAQDQQTAQNLCNQHIASKPGILGGAICVNGKPFTCIKPSTKYPGIPNVDAIRDKCATQHESQHLNDDPCNPNETGIKGPQYLHEQYAGESRAWAASRNCYSSPQSIAACNGNKSCERMLRTLANEAASISQDFAQRYQELEEGKPPRPGPFF